MSNEVDVNKDSLVTLLNNKLKSIDKTKVLIKCLFVIVCTTGLIRQSIQLIAQYTSGQTIVNIKYEAVSYNEIPGITICYPEAISMAALSQRYSQFTPIYENYSNLLQTIDGNEELVNYEVYRKLHHIYYSNVSYQVYRHLNPPLKEVFEFSIPYKMSDTKISINITLNGIELLKNQTIKSISLTDEQPIESIILNPMSSRKWQKCFTFFSHLKTKWRHYQIEVNDIIIKVFYDPHWYPITDDWTENILLSMHSPDEFPQYRPEDFLYLRSFHFHRISYNRWKSMYVSSDYSSRCRNYDLDDHRFYHRMRYNCLKHCIQEKSIECLQCTQNVIQTNYLWTKEDLANLYQLHHIHYTECNMDYHGHTSSIYSEKRINCFTENIFRYETECQVECKSKCVNRYYSFDVRLSADNKYYFKNHTVIEIVHNQSPEPITENMPEMSFIQFASAFGGLLGMWLGLSALAILKFGLKFF